MNVTVANWWAIFGSARQKLLGEFLAEFGTIGIAHDHGRHRTGPAEIVAFERTEHLVMSSALKPPR